MLIEPLGGARVSVSLTEDAEYSVTKAPNGYLIVSVPIPASMRQQEMAAYQAESPVAPGTPDLGISNAYQKRFSLENLEALLTHKQVLVVVVVPMTHLQCLGMSSGFMYDTGSASIKIHWKTYLTWTLSTLISILFSD